MRTFGLFVLGVVAWLVFLVVQVPASYALAHGAPPPGVTFDDVHGTLWHGDARATLRNGGAMIVVDRLAWDFRPLRLFAGRLAYDIEARSPGLEAHGRVEHGFGGFTADHVSARADATLVPVLFPLAAAWQPKGTVTVEAPQLAWNEREITGAARAEWTGAQAAMPQPRALGNYRAELQGSGGPAKLTVRTLSGDYAVRATGTVTPQRIELRGQAGGQDFSVALP